MGNGKNIIQSKWLQKTSETGKNVGKYNIMALPNRKFLREKSQSFAISSNTLQTENPLVSKILQSRGKVEGRIGDILIAAGAIDDTQLREALAQKNQSVKRRLGEILVDMNYITQETLFFALALRHKMPFIDLADYPIDMMAINMISENLARKHMVVPVEIKESELLVAFADPVNLVAKEELAFHTGFNVREALSTPQLIQQAINKYYGVPGEDALLDILNEQGQTKGESEQITLKSYEITETSGKEAPVVTIVNHILNTAIIKDASDIHIVPQADKVNVRFRIDGVLHDELNFSSQYAASIAVRMKIISGMDIAERRLPQDGRAKAKIRNKIVDLRFSCIPSVFGQNIVIRILDKEAGTASLDEVGFYPLDLQNIRRCVSKPYGMILFTGPTGSGKSSSIYACLKESTFKNKQVVTLEDPVEFELPGFCQVQIRENIGLTFAQGLRQILRHDPDVIVVGEMRDSETAKIGIQAALTGHLLISTLHTNNAPEAFVRLADMGVKPFLTSASIIGVVAQRLVRRICPHCKVPDENASGKLSSFPSFFEKYKESSFFTGRGCDHCNNTGYKGRTMIYEFLSVSEEIKSAVAREESASVIQELALKNRMTTLKENAFKKASDGITSLDEVLPLVYELDL